MIFLIIVDSKVLISLNPFSIFSEVDRRMREHFTVYHPESTAEEIALAIGGKRSANVSYRISFISALFLLVKWKERFVFSRRFSSEKCPTLTVASFFFVRLQSHSDWATFLTIETTTIRASPVSGN